MADRIPLVVLTGFLGSGKTTLLRRFLASTGSAGCGVVVNEFGEVGVDRDLLVENAADVELVSAGRANLADVGRALHEIVRRSKALGGFALNRIVFETSGLADPTAIVAALAQDPWLRLHVELMAVVAVVDAAAGLQNLERFPEARKQVAICDTVVITKTDLRTAVAFETLRRQVEAVSPDANIGDAQSPDFDVVDLFRSPPSEARRHAHRQVEDLQTDEMTSFVLSLPEPVDWPVFTVWLSALLHAHGERIVRVKGLIRTGSSQGMLAIHGVQRIMHPPAHVKAAGRHLGPSSLVFITHGLMRSDIERSYRRFSTRFARRAWPSAQACS